MTLETYLKEVCKRTDKATPGPWMAENGYHFPGSCIEAISKPGRVDLIVEDGSYDDEPGVQRKEDADFIAHARTDIPKLLAVIEEYRRREKSAVEAAVNVVQAFGLGEFDLRIKDLEQTLAELSMPVEVKSE